MKPKPSERISGKVHEYTSSIRYAEPHLSEEEARTRVLLTLFQVELDAMSERLDEHAHVFEQKEEPVANGFVDTSDDAVWADMRESEAIRNPAPGCNQGPEMQPTSENATNATYAPKERGDGDAPYRLNGPAFFNREVPGGLEQCNLHDGKWIEFYMEPDIAAERARNAEKVERLKEAAAPGTREHEDQSGDVYSYCNGCGACLTDEDVEAHGWDDCIEYVRREESAGIAVQVARISELEATINDYEQGQIALDLLFDELDMRKADPAGDEELARDVISRCRDAESRAEKAEARIAELETEVHELRGKLMDNAHDVREAAGREDEPVHFEAHLEALKKAHDGAIEWTVQLEGLLEKAEAEAAEMRERLEAESEPEPACRFSNSATVNWHKSTVQPVVEIGERFRGYCLRIIIAALYPIGEPLGDVLIEGRDS